MRRSFLLYVWETRQLDIGDLKSLIYQLPSPFILMSDFNAKDTVWGGSTYDRQSNIFEQLLDTNGIL